MAVSNTSITITSVTDLSDSYSQDGSVRDSCVSVTTIDGNVCGIFFGVNAGLIGLDIGAESVSVGHIVDNSLSSVVICESIRAHLNAMSSLFLSEGTTASVLLIV
jgi:hypothetical protein